MANSYYMASGNPLTRAVASSSTMRAEFAAIQAAFDKLPPPGTGLNGGFLGGVWDNAQLNNANITSADLASIGIGSTKAGFDVFLGPVNSAITTSATVGFVWISKCAGTPTGTPSGVSQSTTPMIYDTTNNRLCVYNGGAWRTVALA